MLEPTPIEGFQGLQEPGKKKSYFGKQKNIINISNICMHLKLHARKYVIVVISQRVVRLTVSP